MSPINATARGRGTPVILIHGFPLNHRMWDPFADSLSGNFKVYTPDLPGFGKSSPAAGNFTLDDIAQLMLDWMAESGIIDAIVIGHSLGGYVSLAMVKKDPARFKGLVLFHSTALPDSAEKKDNRNKVLEFITTNGVRAFTSNFIEPLFFDKKHPAMATIRSIATEAPEAAVRGYTMAMRDRPDRQDVLREFKGNILLIGGAHDAGINPESLQKQALLSSRIHLEVLDSSAHMGMYEETDKTLRLIEAFARQSNPL